MVKPTDENSGSQPSGNDPRLKSFLRQAQGIIAAERGLNTQSQIKLRSLAIHMKLPNQLFELALDKLKQTKKVNEFDRWEKAFVEFLDGEFSKLTSGIVTIASETRAVDLAKRKYQIDEVRARQLISERADALGKGRVAPEDAKKYVEQIILTRIGKLTVVDGPLREQLYQSGLTWGLDRGEVDALVLGQLVRNRKHEKGRRRRKLLVTLVVVLVACCLGYAGHHLEWWAKAYTFLFAKPAEELVDLEKPAPIVESESTVDWWNEEVAEAFDSLAENHPKIRSAIKKISAVEPDTRVEGFVQIAEFVCEISEGQGEDVVELLVEAYCREPDDRVGSEAMEQLLDRLSPTENRLPNRDEFEVGFRVQKMLNQFWFLTREQSETNERFTERNKLVGEAIFDHFGVPPDDLSPDELDRQTESLLAQDQWDHIVRNSWTSAAQASVLIKPLYDLTLGKMDRALANQLRARAIEEILRVDEGHWKELRESIEHAIKVSDDIKVVNWIEIYESSSSREFGDFLGRLLVAKSEVPVESNQRSDVATALANVRMRYLTRRLQPLVSRNDLASDFSNKSMGKAGVQEFEMTPQSVARLAFAANAALALANAMDNRDREFDQFDYWIADGLPDLKQLFPAGDKYDSVRARSTTASDSENRLKREAIQQLANYRSLSPTLRQSAIDQLARVARRFEQISYPEAVSLSDYLLSEMPLAEWLNIEKNISAFVHWPNLGLALADRLPNSTVTLDQAMTLLNLIFKVEFSSTNTSQWREEIQSEIYRLVSVKLDSGVQTKSSRALSWARLNSYLLTAYKFRHRQLQTAAGSQTRPSSAKTSDWAIANAELVVEASSLAGSDHIRQGITLIDQSSFVDMETTILANQSLARAIAQQLAGLFPARKWEIDEILLEYQQLANSFNTNGQRLYLTELMLLQLWDIRRSELLQRKFKKVK